MWQHFACYVPLPIPEKFRVKNAQKVVSNIYQYKKLQLCQSISKLYNRLQEDLGLGNNNPGIKSCAANILCCMRLELFPE
jgi:hypothetical protein